MNRLKNILAAIFVSPEALAILLIFANFYFLPDYFSLLGKNIRSDPEIWKYLPTLPSLFAGAAITFSAKINAPLENTSNKKLYQWSDYQLLKDRVYVGIFLAILAAFVSLFLWIFGGKWSEKIIGLLFLMSVISSGITALTMFLAPQSLREYLEKHD